jgi:hypothetical protein
MRCPAKGTHRLPNPVVTHSVLELGFWSFFGFWILDFGILRMLPLGGGPVAAFVAGLTSISPRIYRECCGVAGPGEGWVWVMPIAGPP